MTTYPPSTPPGDPSDRLNGTEPLVRNVYPATGAEWRAATPPTSESRAAAAPTIGAMLEAAYPGLLLVVAIAGLSFALRRLPALSAVSPMIIAAIIGMALKNTFGTFAAAIPGIKFSMRLPLRIAIVLLGFQLTLTQIAALGLAGVFILLSCVAATFFFTVMAGRLIGVDERLANLIAAGTSICGASAILAANTVVKADDEDVAYALGCITLFGSLAMFVYPLIAQSVALDAQSFGIWAGASVHEVGQVVATSFQQGQTAGEIGTIAKLTRVLALAPMIVAIAYLRKSDNKTGRPSPAPWFVVGFAVLPYLTVVPAGRLVREGPTDVLRQDPTIVAAYLGGNNA